MRRVYVPASLVSSAFPRSFLPRISHDFQLPRFFCSRKHVISRGELLNKTNKLLVHASDPVSANLEKSSTQDCFDTLEAWMERAAYETETLKSLDPAARLLKALEDNTLAASSDTVLVPNATMYDVMLHTYAHIGKRNATIECEKVLKRMIANYEAYAVDSKPWKRSPVAPTTKTFNICINAWAKSSDSDSGLKAESLLELMQNWSVKCRKLGLPAECKPSSVTFVCIVDAWAKSGDPVAPERVSLILQSLIQNGESILLSQQLFNSCISVWARSRRGREAAEKCDELTNLMVRLDSKTDRILHPTSFTLAAQILGWAGCERSERRGSASNRAVELLKKALHDYQAGIGPKPNAVCFSNCILARSWATQTQNFSLDCERLWDLLTKVYEQSGSDVEVRPDLHMANIILGAYSRDRQLSDNTDRATAFITKMKRFVDPDLVSYSTVLDALGRKGRSREALDLITWLESPRSKIQPDIMCYNRVLSAFAKDKHQPASEVERMIQRMSLLAVTHEDLRPDKVSFTIAIDAWAKSENSARIDKVSQILRKMIENSRKDPRTRPDIFTLTAILKVCSQAVGSSSLRRSAFDTCLHAWKAIDSQTYGTANDITYSTMVKAVQRLCEDEESKKELLSLVFKRCIESGNLSESVFRAVQRYGVTRTSLKSSWSRNVALSFRPYNSQPVKE